MLYLSGKITEGDGSKPLENVELKFYYTKSGYYIILKPIKLLGKTFSKADGSYTFTFDSKDFRSPDGYFDISGSKEGYILKPKRFDDGVFKTFYLDSTKINIPQISNINIYKRSTLKIRIVKSSNINYEFLNVFYNFDKSGYGLGNNISNLRDTTIVVETGGNVFTKIRWDAKVNGFFERKIDSLIVPGGGEATYLINL